MFDALGYSESLAKLGVPADNARLQAKALSEAFKSNNLATTEDVFRLESKTTETINKLEFKTTEAINKLDSKITVVESNLTSKISEMKFEFIKWMIGMFFAITGMMFALLRFMLPSIPLS